MKLTARTLAFALALAPAIALAADRKDDTSRKDDTTRTVESKNPDQLMTDARIASVLHHVNQMEIDAGKLAEKRGQGSEVKELGRTLQKDHKDADAKLTSLAKKAKLSLNDLNGPDKDKLEVDKEKMEQVKKLQGAEFDRAFGSAMSEGHENVLKLLDDHGKDIRSPELKQFADETRPVLEHHKDLADKIAGGSASRSMGRSADRPPRDTSGSARPADKDLDHDKDQDRDRSKDQSQEPKKY